MLVSNPDASAMQVVKDVICQMLSDSEFALPTPLVERAKDCIRKASGC